MLIRILFFLVFIISPIHSAFSYGYHMQYPHMPPQMCQPDYVIPVSQSTKDLYDELKELKQELKEKKSELRSFKTSNNVLSIQRKIRKSLDKNRRDNKLYQIISALKTDECNLYSGKKDCQLVSTELESHIANLIADRGKKRQTCTAGSDKGLCASRSFQSETEDGTIFNSLSSFKDRLEGSEYEFNSFFDLSVCEVKNPENCGNLLPEKYSEIWKELDLQDDLNTLAEFKDKKADIAELEEDIKLMNKDLSKYAADDQKDGESLEAEICVNCDTKSYYAQARYRQQQAAKPTQQEQVFGLLSLGIKALTHYKLADKLSERNAQLGWPTNSHLSGAGLLAVPYLLNGIYGAVSGGTGRRSLSCAGSMGGNAWSHSVGHRPYSFHNNQYPYGAWGPNGPVHGIPYAALSNRFGIGPFGGAFGGGNPYGGAFGGPFGGGNPYGGAFGGAFGGPFGGGNPYGGGMHSGIPLINGMIPGLGNFSASLGGGNPYGGAFGGPFGGAFGGGNPFGGPFGGAFGGGNPFGGVNPYGGPFGGAFGGGNPFGGVNPYGGPFGGAFGGPFGGVNPYGGGMHSGIPLINGMIPGLGNFSASLGGGNPYGGAFGGPFGGAFGGGNPFGGPFGGAFGGGNPFGGPFGGAFGGGNPYAFGGGNPYGGAFGGGNGASMMMANAQMQFQQQMLANQQAQMQAYMDAQRARQQRISEGTRVIGNLQQELFRIQSQIQQVYTGIHSPDYSFSGSGSRGSRGGVGSGSRNNRGSVGSGSSGSSSGRIRRTIR